MIKSSAPASSGESPQNTVPPAWKSGSVADRTSPDPMSPSSAPPRAASSWLRWVRVTSFGLPVVPPVWKYAATSSSLPGSTSNRSAGWSAINAAQVGSAVSRGKAREVQGDHLQSRHQATHRLGLLPQVQRRVWAQGDQDVGLGCAYELGEVLRVEQEVQRYGVPRTLRAPQHRVGLHQAGQQVRHARPWAGERGRRCRPGPQGRQDRRTRRDGAPPPPSPSSALSGRRRRAGGPRRARRRRGRCALRPDHRRSCCARAPPRRPRP